MSIHEAIQKLIQILSSNPFNGTISFIPVNDTIIVVSSKMELLGDIPDEIEGFKVQVS